MSTLKNVSNGWNNCYDEGSKDYWGELENPTALFTRALVKRGEPLDFLDLGTGDGRNLHWWLEKHQVTALDISPAALAAIRRSCQKQHIKPPVLTQGSITELPYQENSFQLVQAIDVIPQVANTKKAITEGIRVLRPGGNFVFNLFSPQDCAFGEGTKVGHNTWRYKDTLFVFHSLEEVLSLIPSNAEVIRQVEVAWIDEPHGKFRPYRHKHHCHVLHLRKRITK